jgi:hypothetical protein
MAQSYVGRVFGYCTVTAMLENRMVEVECSICNRRITRSIPNLYRTKTCGLDDCRRTSSLRAKHIYPQESPEVLRERRLREKYSKLECTTIGPFQVLEYVGEKNNRATAARQFFVVMRDIWESPRVLSMQTINTMYHQWQRSQERKAWRVQYNQERGL